MARRESALPRTCAWSCSRAWRASTCCTFPTRVLRPPPPIVARLNAEAIRSLRSDEMKERLAVDGAEPQGSTPEEFAALIASELEKWGRVTRAAGIEPQ